MTELNEIANYPARKKLVAYHCVKSVQIRSFSGPYFPVFGLNAEIYSVNLRIPSKCGKIRTRKTLYFGSFYAVYLFKFFKEKRKTLQKTRNF